MSLAQQRVLDPDGLERLRSEFGSTGMLPRLVELYGTQTPDLLAALRRAIAADDASAVRDSAHKLKGGSLTLAATRTAERCKELEARAQAGSLDGAESLVTEIEGAFREALAALRVELLQSH